jgi:FkbM family methyltransferase
MQIAEVLRRISYTPWLATCVRRVGLRKAMQGLYAELRSNPRSVKLSLNGVGAVFSTRTPLELRCVEGTWFCEKEMLSHVLSNIRAGDVFVDVGANLGLFTVFAAKVAGPTGTVLAFEPENRARQRLAENIGLNGLGNVQLFSQALSDKRATEGLALGDPNAVSQSAHLADCDGPSQVVEVADYDSLVTCEGLRLPNVVKMDIEGHEFAALNGMRTALSSAVCRALVCEIHPLTLPVGVSAGRVIELIKSFGFESVSAEKRSEQVHCVALKNVTTGTTGTPPTLTAHAAAQR